MLREKATVFNSPGAVSPKVFRVHARTCLQTLQEKEVNLRRIYTFFTQSCWIWPEQGKQVISFLGTVSELLQQCNIVLEEFQLISAPGSGDYRAIAMSVQNTNEHIKALIPLLEQICISRVPSQKYAGYLQDICRVFHLILRSYTHILHGIPLLLDQARFLSRR